MEKGKQTKGWGCKIIYNFDNVYQLKAHLLLLGDIIMQLSSANVDCLYPKTGHVLTCKYEPF